MAPKRKLANDSTAAGTTVNRRSARLANVAVATPAADPEPRKRNKAKTAAAPPAADPGPRKTKKAKTAAAAPPAADPGPRKTKKAKTAAVAKEEVETETESPPSPAEQKPVSAPKTIIIEHCKQCNAFKTRAIQVKLGLEKSVGGVKVLVNPEKPRRGCFEIREEGGGIFVSLLEMKRPFQPMKDLDMGKVISDIVEKLS